MKIIEPSFEIMSEINGEDILRKIELFGRVCYKSEDRITGGSAEKFAAGILRNGHESVIEHISLTVRLICDRGVTHEIVRHRLASYSQESTRYCNYTGGKFGSELTLIRPYFWENDSEQYLIWLDAMRNIEENYNKLIALGAKPEEARSILPNSLKTELIMTMNLRQWRHFFKLRAAPQAHPQMRQVVIPLLTEIKRQIPVVFDDV